MKLLRRGFLAVVAIALFLGLGTVSMALTLPDGTEFDAEYYASHNPDVVAVLGTDPEALLNHYLICGKAEGRKCYQTAEDLNHEMETEMLAIINQHRGEAGVGGLSLNSSLCQAARIRAQEMCENGYFAHQRPDGSSVFNIFSEVGYKYSTAGENIAMGQRTVEWVMDSWMNSSGHRANILNSKFTEVGVGRYENYWVQLFGRSR